MRVRHLVVAIGLVAFVVVVVPLEHCEPVAHTTPQAAVNMTATDGGVVLTHDGGGPLDPGPLTTLLLRVRDGDSDATATRVVLDANSTASFEPDDRRVVPVTLAGGPPDAGDTLSLVWEIDTGEPHVDWGCLSYDDGVHRETLSTTPVEGR